jgi:YebC/PmpR family DNA-binding regulatory protein
MSKEVIERAIHKAEKDASNFEEITFEGYGIGGIAIYVECLSDNNNRTVGSVRSSFTKFGGHLGTNGSLNFLFDRKGVFVLKNPGTFDVEEFELEMIDVGAEDFEENENLIMVTTAMEDFGNVSKKLEEMGIEPESQDLQRIPHNTTLLSIEDSKKILRLVEKLEDDDDVQKVYHNLEITEDLEKDL